MISGRVVGSTAGLAVSKLSDKDNLLSLCWAVSGVNIGPQ